MKNEIFDAMKAGKYVALIGMAQMLEFAEQWKAQGGNVDGFKETIERENPEFKIVCSYETAAKQDLFVRLVAKPGDILGVLALETIEETIADCESKGGEVVYWEPVLLESCGANEPEWLTALKSGKGVLVGGFDKAMELIAAALSYGFDGDFDGGCTRGLDRWRKDFKDEPFIIYSAEAVPSLAASGKSGEFYWCTEQQEVAMKLIPGGYVNYESMEIAKEKVNELEVIEAVESTKIELGNFVEVTDWGRNYPWYPVKDSGADEKRFMKNRAKRVVGDIGKVIGIMKHNEITSEEMYLIEVAGCQYLLGGKGVKKSVKKPKKSQEQKWLERAAKRGFVPGAQFFGVQDIGKTTIVKIGEDGVKADEVGTYYGDARIMQVKNGLVSWAAPLFTEIGACDPITNNDNIAIEFVDEPVNDRKVGIMYVGRNGKGFAKFGCVNMRNDAHNMLSGINYDETEKVTHTTVIAVMNQFEKCTQPHRFLKFNDKESMVKWLLID